jgi:hypothetical protein
MGYEWMTTASWLMIWWLPIVPFGTYAGWLSHEHHLGFSEL